MHDGGASSSDVLDDGRTWYYATDLTGGLGLVHDEGGGAYSIKLDDSDTGVTTVPEPGTGLVVVLGGLAVLVRRRRRSPGPSG